VKQIKASWLPTISAFYSYTYKYIKPQFDITPKSYVGVQASWPLFNSGGTLSQIRQAKLQAQINANDLTALSDQLSVQDQQARFNLKNGHGQSEDTNKKFRKCRIVFLPTLPENMITVWQIVLI